MDSERILMIDDEENILLGLKRQLHGRFKASFAVGPVKGLLTIKNDGPFAVVVSDIRMPNVDGISFLSRLKQASPDTVRMILTGDANINNAVDAVNRGEVFRYLQKPCQLEELSKALSDGIAMYRATRRERELRERTLKSSIRMLVDLLAMVNPPAFRRSRVLRFYMAKLCEELGIGDSWEFEVAAMLSQIGFVNIPIDIITKYHAGGKLSLTERKMVDSVPSIGRNIIGKIPRLERVAVMIGGESGHSHRTAFDEALLEKNPAKAGNLMLEALIEYDLLVERGTPNEEAAQSLANSPSKFDRSIVAKLAALPRPPSPKVTKAVEVAELANGMILAADVNTPEGMMVASKDTEVNGAIKQILLNYLALEKINKFCRVYMPEA